ncbi:MAG: PDC sensor domain-containing protein [Actinobacteria bacterium]|nr:PDC sensor domain-containing protein [Actinomycetota bacterium]
MSARDTNLDTVLDDLELLVGRLFDFLELVRQELYARLEEADAAGGAPTLETISGLARVLQGRLALEGTLVAGAGISFAPDVLAGSPRHMEWWTRPREEARSQPLPVSYDPQSLSFYDYLEAEWFVCARDHGACVVGPYVDAFGTDEDVITLSLSCLHAGAFVGVCSLDLRAGELGVRVTRALRELDRGAALVNAEGRVIASTVVAHLPGSLLRDLEPGRRRGERTGWSVLPLD